MNLISTTKNYYQLFHLRWKNYSEPNLEAKICGSSWYTKFDGSNMRLPNLDCKYFDISKVNIFEVHPRSLTVRP